MFSRVIPQASGDSCTHAEDPAGPENNRWNIQDLLLLRIAAIGV